jgi:hypothetical protein
MRFIADYPDSTSPADFKTCGDTFVQDLNGFTTDYTTAAGIGITGGLFNTTSTTSNNVSYGQKTFVLVADIDVLPDMHVTVGYTTTPSNYMYGIVNSYTPASKTLVFTPLVVSGSGTGLTAWTVSVSASGRALIGETQSEVLCVTPNGVGSTNTKIRKYTSTAINAGSDITYASSATNGDSFTVNKAGLYVISVADACGTAVSMYYGVSINATGMLTTDFNTITESMKLMRGRSVHTIASGVGTISACVRLVATDVIRHHVSGTDFSTVNSYFHMYRMGS